MSKTEMFLQYADEAMRCAEQSRDAQEKRTLTDIASTWSHAALQCKDEEASFAAPKMNAVEPMRDPFLLPVCRCGGPANLALVEPDPARSDYENRIYRCAHCSSLETYPVKRRATASSILNRD
jgi:hypothetical protein